MTESKRLPHNIIITLITQPAFSEVIDHCLAEPELIENFTRIYGVDLPRQPASPIVALVDEVTGWRDEQYRQFFSEFIPFVHRCVWLPLYGETPTGQKGAER